VFGLSSQENKAMIRGHSERAIQQRPAEVVTAVSRVFRRHGFEGATMSVLSKETGLGRSSLYHHFPDGKAGMALAALTRVETFLRDKIAPLTQGIEPAQGRGQAMVMLFLDYYENGSLGCIIGAFSLQDCPPEVTIRARAVIELWIDQFAAFYAKTAVADPRRSALDAIAAIQGALVLSALSDEPNLLRFTLESYLVLR
jgi:TetR/AcrR family transcriptional regulator, lmrAB and yxaGH operons repressor